MRKGWAVPTRNEPQAPARSHGFRYVLPIVVFLCSAVYLGWRLPQEPFFDDESATLAHTYYYRLVMEGRFHDVDWLHPASYDHLQVGRLLAGAALDAGGFDVPTSVQPMEEWWRQATTTGVEPPDDWGQLLAARWAMLVGAALGCTMTFIVGRMLVGPLTGFLAAALLALSPVYARHARLALADDWAQALLLAGLAVWMAMSRRAAERPWRIGRGLSLALSAGVLFGLAAQTKLNGGIGLAAMLAAVLVVSALVPLSKLRPTVASVATWAAGSVVAAATAVAVFIAIHPYFYAQPDLGRRDHPSPEWVEKIAVPLVKLSVVGRLGNVLRHRSDTLDEMLQENRFSDFWLPSVPSRWNAIVREGMGRWSAAGRTGWQPLLAALPMFGLVALGAVWCVAEGRRQWRAGRIPVAWVIVTWSLVEIVVLSRGLTLDWDRYYMGVVCWSSLLAALGVGGTLTSVGRKLVLAPPTHDRPSVADMPSSASGEGLPSGPEP